ncbi:MAG: hypothetical protein KDK45_13570, partial [Leptospiraceae bacterium]|nr:hypothetical protein [Leptospiraceae bacterium]
MKRPALFGLASRGLAGMLLPLSISDSFLSIKKTVFSAQKMNFSSSFLFAGILRLRCLAFYSPVS